MAAHERVERAGRERPRGRCQVGVHALDAKVIAILNNVEPGQKFYSVSVADLEDLGLVVSRIRLISFVVDHGLAGDGNHVGTFHVVTDGLAP